MNRHRVTVSQYATQRHDGESANPREYSRIVVYVIVCALMLHIRVRLVHANVSVQVTVYEKTTQPDQSRDKHFHFCAALAATNT